MHKTMQVCTAWLSELTAKFMPKTSYTTIIQRRIVKSISPYLTAGEERYVVQSEVPLSADVPAMVSGNMARDGGNLILSRDEADYLLFGSQENPQNSLGSWSEPKK